MFFIHNHSADASLLARALVGACRLPTGWVEPIQIEWLDTLFGGLLDFYEDFETLEPARPADVKRQLPSPKQRVELIELMVCLVMFCNPIPKPLCRSVEHWAEALDVNSDALVMMGDLAHHRQDLATHNWYRYSWIGRDVMQRADQAAQLETHGTMALALNFEADQQEAEQWRQLKDSPPGSLGKSLHQMHEGMNFKLPGEPGATNASLAKHEWVHTITGINASPLGEIAVAAYIAAAGRSAETTLAFLGTISIFQASLLNYHTAQSQTEALARYPRYGDALAEKGALDLLLAAIQYGMLCPVNPVKDLDYFAIANQPLLEIRTQWHLPAAGLSLHPN